MEVGLILLRLIGRTPSWKSGSVVYVLHRTGGLGTLSLERNNYLSGQVLVPQSFPHKGWTSFSFFSSCPSFCLPSGL